MAALLLAAAPALAAGSIQVRVADADWGEVETPRIAAVLQATARELAPLFPGDATLRVLVSPGGTGPMVLFQRTPHDEYHVLLRARGENWAHYAYEFGHELGHILTNYTRHASDPLGARHQWFEEALCDMLAVTALRRMAAHAPDVTGAPYAGFADLVLEEPHRRDARGLDLAAWLRDNEAALRADPYQRKRNETATTRLLDIFSHESRLRALAYLNQGDSPVPATFRAYLEEWRDRTPEALRPAVLEVLAAFGFAKSEKPPAAVAAGGLSRSY